MISSDQAFGIANLIRGIRQLHPISVGHAHATFDLMGATLDGVGNKSAGGGDCCGLQLPCGRLR